MAPPVLLDPYDIDALIAFHRATFGDTRMDTEGTGEGGSGEGGTGGAGPPKDPPDEKLLPQSRVNEIVAERTAEAKASALADLAKELGCTIEEAKQFVKDRKDADEKNATELQKAQKVAEDAVKDRDDKGRTSAAELHAERLDRALIGLGVPDEDAKLTRLRGMFTVAVGATREDIKKDADKLKADFPALFEVVLGNGRKPPASDPGKKPGGGKIDDSAYARGLARAAAHGHGPDAENRVEPLPIPGLSTT